MTWKPRHEAHAIERVRVMFPFSGPLTTKILREASADAIAHSQSYGFDSVIPAESSIQGINISIAPRGNVPQSLKATSQKNGTVLQRHSDGDVVEEVGFRDGVFGYVTTTYGRWKNLLGRLKQIVFPSLLSVDKFVDLDSLKLEYWDSFTFSGAKNDADATQLLELVDNSVPIEVIRGASQWHSHVGWFERDGELQILINRNIDVADREGDHGLIRVLAIYTMVEMRNIGGGLAIKGIEHDLETLHRRSLKLFGETLSETHRKMIGLNLDRYR